MTIDWIPLVERAVSVWETPLYLCAWSPLEEAIGELAKLDTLQIPVRHWLSFKTHPLKALVKRWRDTGNGVEVVSEYEFLAAMNEGYLPERILVNGVAKHRWLGKYSPKGIRVHFDSVHEVRSLAHIAKALSWRVGLRLHTEGEVDPDESQFPGQFGMSRDEFCEAACLLRNVGIEVESVHFHLRSNVPPPSMYGDAITDVGDACQKSFLEPQYIDCGGGLPAPGEWPSGCPSVSVAFDIDEFVAVLQAGAKKLPSLREIWLENGRFLTARSGVLVVKVVDLKNRQESRYLICDGGRTNHALVSDWEEHVIFTLPRRSGQPILTTICGPTCMAFDRLTRRELSDDIQIGDFLVWQNAGAYHIPWETRFSGGLACVLCLCRF